ncbi:ABC transporter permease [Pseudarthrobacter oxydans]|uniref:ABC transporter permease n=1 Tax=Pseudarthrobacter oxydans TaxID=1671 RepID=UPI00381CBB75
MLASELELKPRTKWRPSRTLLGVIGLLGFMAIAQVLPVLGIVNPLFFPPFSSMVTALVGQFSEPSFWAALLATLSGWALGLGIAMAAGTVLGVVIGGVPFLRTVTASTIEFLRPIPAVALIPLIVLLFGVGTQPTLFLVVYGTFWQVLIQILYGVQDVDPVAMETERSYRLNYWMRTRTLVWPTVLPYLLTGFRLGAAVALILEVTGELIIGSPGLGKQIAISQSSNAISDMYALVIVTGLIGVAVNIAPRLIEKRLLHWHPSVRKDTPR